jgi:hypothetical protein
MAEESHDIREDLAAYLDGELGEAARARVDARLAGDAALRAELNALREIDALYRALPLVNAPEDFDARLRDRLDDERTAAEPIRLSTRRRHERQRRVWPMLAAAALVATMAGLYVPYFFSGPPERFDVATSQQAPGLAREDTAADGVVYEFEVREFAEPAPSPATPERPRPESAARTMTPDTREDLQALGYLQDEAAVIQEALPFPPTSAKAGAEIAADPATTAPMAEAMQAPAVETPPAPEVSAEPVTPRARTFAPVGGIHIQSGYAGEAYTRIDARATVLEEARAADTALRALLAAGATVLFEVKGQWYLAAAAN